MQNSFFLPRSGFFARLAVGVCLLVMLVLGVSLTGILGFSIAHADGGQANFALKPVLYDPSNPVTQSYFVFDSKPGIVVKSSVRVTNTGTARGSVSLYTVDATTGQTSGAVYLNHDDPRKDVGAWMTLGARQLTLNPGQNQVVSFEVAIPSKVRPGQHLGGIVAENLTQSSSQQNNSAIQIKVKNLTIVAVQVNLPGTSVEQLVGTGVQAGGDNGYQQLLLGLSNTGTVMLKPSGSLQVANAQGQVVKNVSLKLDTFLPQTAIYYPVAITGHSLHYTARFTITQQQITQTFGSTASKTQLPPGFGDGPSGLSLWQMVLVAGGVLALLWVVGNMIYKRLVTSKAKSASTHSSQFKKPTF